MKIKWFVTRSNVTAVGSPSRAEHEDFWAISAFVIREGSQHFVIWKPHLEPVNAYLGSVMY